MSHCPEAHSLTVEAVVDPSRERDKRGRSVVGGVVGPDVRPQRNKHAHVLPDALRVE